MSIWVPAHFQVLPLVLAAYQDVGRVTEAITLFEQVPAPGNRPGPDHPDTLISRDSLAAAYRDAGRVTEAIRLHEQVLAARSPAVSCAASYDRAGARHMGPDVTLPW
jgi:tetratricopeptide repeat protein